MSTKLPLLVATLCFCAVNAPGQDLKITLGERNIGAGLRVLSAADGVNAPVVAGGLSARRVAGLKSHYLYVAVDYPDPALRSSDLYVIVEAYDDNLYKLRVQYDKESDAPTVATRYTVADRTMLLTGSGRWRKECIYLSALRLEHGENLGADFRLVSDGIAIHSIEVTSHRPEGFDPNTAVDPETLHALQVNRPAGMELLFGNQPTAAQAAVFKSLGATAIQNSVDWAEVEPIENQWDWSESDKEVSAARAAGLKWAPFLIAGPAYATPLWFQRGPRSHFYRCLEDGEETRVQSIFNPELRPCIERFLQAFALRYRDSGVIESVLLGISGIYGESIYPAGDPEAGGGWTAKLTGPYHCRAGWWAGDPYAAVSFRKAMGKAYTDITALNNAWGTRYGSFAEVMPFLPDQAPNERARFDFVEWYERSMTEWAAFWADAARRAFPKTEIYLATGGNGDPILGADFTAQAAAIAPFGVGMRITNENSDYTQDFTLTREVATATRYYGTFFGLEPAGQLNPAGVVACMYNAAASGARESFFYETNVLGSLQNLKSFRGSARWLQPRQPLVNVAFYLSHESWGVDPTSLRECYGDSSFLRGFVDHDYVTRRSIEDGILKNYRALVLADSPVLDNAAAALIERWVERGGTLIALTRNGQPIGGRLYDNREWRARLFAGAFNRGNDGPRITRINKGYSVLIDHAAPSPRMAQYLNAILHNSPQFPGGEPLAPPDSGIDGRFITKTREGVLSFDRAGAKIEGF